MVKLIKNLAMAMVVGLCLSSFDFKPNQMIALVVLITFGLSFLNDIVEELQKINKK